MLKKSAKGVTFTFDEPSESPVYLAGDFNNWDTQSHPLTQGPGKRWSITIDLPPGECQFRYVKNGEWCNDHKADKYVPNNSNSDNSVVVVPASAAAPRKSAKTSAARRRARRK